MKVLAAAQPLSLQTHPDAAQARAGYDAGVFADPNPKPELLCALTPFEALCGVRPIEPTLDCIIDNASAAQIRALAAESVLGATESSVQIVSDIVSQPETLTCLATKGLPALLR